MKFLPWIWHKEDEGRSEALKLVQKRFTSFMDLLEANNHVLRLVSDLEEQTHGERLIDLDNFRSIVGEIRAGVVEIIEAMIDLGGSPYEVLGDRYEEIDAEIESHLTGSRPIVQDEFTLPFEKLDRDHRASVGTKNAQLGELRSRLGLPVPDGFAITAWAYKHFLDANKLRQRIAEYIEAVDIRRYDDLVRVSEEIRELIMASPVPEDLSDAILHSFVELSNRSEAQGYAIRSSAIGEDTRASFAGQYTTFLNVRGEEVVDRYREVVASKFTPKAIYYLLSQSFQESELAMSVGCVAMVDAVASGVVYTRDPVRPEDDSVLVNSIFGLGPYLVNGTITPDLFRVSRTDGRVLESVLARKPVRLVMRPGSGTEHENVPEDEQERPSLSPRQLNALRVMALRIESHHRVPQDVEWALDRAGQLFLLQARPLRVLRAPAPGPESGVGDLERILAGGATVFPGAGFGPVRHASSSAEVSSVEDGCVLVAPRPFPGLVAALERARALVTEVGGVASHMATLAREYGLPTVMGLEGAMSLPAGERVTVDATGAAVYAGEHPELVEARKPVWEPVEGGRDARLFARVLEWISPLNLVHPAAPDFVAENCRTFHDIVRFSHQKSLQAMLERATGLGRKEHIGLRLISDIPLRVNLMYLDQDPESHADRRSIEEDEIRSEPMKAFWTGVKKEGWPRPAADLKGFMSVVGSQMTGRSGTAHLEDSYAILSREYMILSLRMGYHFNTFEALASPEISKNFIRFQVKEGGASLERRVRRVRLITSILESLGFENSSKGDFLDSRISYLSDRAVLERLQLLGRLSILTKQLDMALSSDSVADWYTEDIKRKLGIAGNAGDEK